MMPDENIPCPSEITEHPQKSAAVNYAFPAVSVRRDNEMYLHGAEFFSRS
jgi:hypothetical protein